MKYDPYTDTYTVGRRDVMMSRNILNGWVVFAVGALSGAALGAALTLLAT